MFCYISLRPLAINYARLEPHRRNHGELKEVNAEVRAADCLDETRWSFKQGIVSFPIRFFPFITRSSPKIYTPRASKELG